jgi:hypothetical protein
MKFLPSLRDLVPLFFDLPRTYVLGYFMPSLRDWGLAIRSVSSYLRAGCGAAEAAPFQNRESFTRR